MACLIFVSHPAVVIDPHRPVPDWGLSAAGRAVAATLAGRDIVQRATHIWSSAERKAQDTAAILADRLGLPVSTRVDLGENDRSATGFLPPADFEAAADAFFAAPDQSYRGWETARAAQARIVEATRTIVAQHGAGDVIIVSHGGVGTLLWCHLAGVPIDRRHDQPGQGCYWIADLPALAVRGPWQQI